MKMTRQPLSVLILAMVVGFSLAYSGGVNDTVPKIEAQGTSYSNSYHDSAYDQIKILIDSEIAKNETERANNADYAEKNFVVNKSIRNATWAAAIFAALAFGVSLLVLVLSAKERRHELMAYVYPSKIEIRGVQDWTTNIDGKRTDGLDINDSSPHLEILITFKNTGHTPAFNFQHIGAAFPQRPGYANNPNFVKWWKRKGDVSFQSSATIPPNQEVTVVVLSTEIKGMRKAAFINGANYLYFEGLTMYRTLGREVRGEYRYIRMNSLIALEAGAGIEFEKGTGILICEKGNKTFDRSFWYACIRRFFKRKRRRVR